MHHICAQFAFSQERENTGFVTGFSKNGAEVKFEHCRIKTPTDTHDHLQKRKSAPPILYTGTQNDPTRSILPAYGREKPKIDVN